MLKRYKKQLIISSIIILLPILAGLLMWNNLPDSLTTHWGVNDVANGWSSKATAVFLLPLILLAVHWFSFFITSKDSKNIQQNPKIFSMVLWIIPAISLITCGSIYSISLGDISGDSTFTFIALRALFGILFIVIGNYMPKCKQNRTIGIKIKWTLHNEENWNKTHRFAGKVWFFGGMFILATLLVPFEIITFVFMITIFILALVPVMYSYRYYKKQLKTGNITKDTVQMTSEEKKVTKISTVVGIFILVLAFLFITTGDFEVRPEDNALHIEALYWENATVPYTEIDHIEYREQDDPGSRTYGFGSLKLLLGKFQNSEFGSYTRYSYTSCDSCIVITVNDNILVVNAADEEKTKVLYEELVKKMIP